MIDIFAKQPSAIIARTEAPRNHRRAFLGQTAATMLTVLGAASPLASASGPKSTATLRTSRGSGAKKESTALKNENQADRLPPGSYPALLTAFRKDLSIDWHGVDQLIDFCIQGGSAGIFAGGLSAEIDFMSDREKAQLVEHIVRYTNGRVPVVACVITRGSIETQAELIRQASTPRPDAVAISVGQLAAPAEDERAWIRHCDELLRKTPEQIPLAFYECPWPYHRLLADGTIAWVAGTGRFCFLKDTCCNIERIRSRLELLRGSRLKLYNANTKTLLDSLAAGAAGFCGIGANYAPELYAWLCREYAHEPSVASELHHYLQSCVSLTEGPAYPVLAKEYLRRHGLKIGRFSRRRSTELSRGLVRRLEQMRVAEDLWKARLQR